MCCNFQRRCSCTVLVIKSQKNLESIDCTLSASDHSCLKFVLCGKVTMIGQQISLIDSTTSCFIFNRGIGQLVPSLLMTLDFVYWQLATHFYHEMLRVIFIGVRWFTCVWICFCPGSQTQKAKILWPRVKFVNPLMAQGIRTSFQKLGQLLFPSLDDKHRQGLFVISWTWILIT